MAYSNQELVDELVELGYLKTPSLIDAFKTIDRGDFVPANVKEYTYYNDPLPIGFEQTISQPLTVAFMLELLDLKAGDKVLEIGSGSGWQTALIAKMIEHIGGAAEDKDGRYGMVAIERIPGLKEMTVNNIKKYGFIERGVVKVVLGDGSKGYESEAPFDKIIAAASAIEVPENWKQQLIIGGRIVAPVGGSIVVLDKTGKNDFEEREFRGFAFVPLIKDNG
jgi:protein-L-isoaspartate(D-aspartate) O-methyltransferase